MSYVADIWIQHQAIGNVACGLQTGNAKRDTLKAMQRMIGQPPPSTQQVPAWLLDMLLGVAVTLVIALVISADVGGRINPDALAYVFAGGFGALMLVRRRFPVAVLVLTMLLLFAYYIVGYPPIGLAVPVAAALYSAAERGRISAAIAISTMLVIVSTYFRLRDGESVAYLFGYELVSTVTLMAAAIALGDSVRSRRDLRAEQQQTARLIAQEHAHRAEQQIQAERVRMARDLHDVIGHSISVISLHADVAREAIGSTNAEAHQALTHIRVASSATMRELRATVKLLRRGSGEQIDGSMISLANLAPLIENASASGLHVDVQIEGEVDHLAATVDAAAYRIIQEALTNIIRHAAATQVVLTIEIDSHTLRLHIIDNGSTGRDTIIWGSGIVGMSERARLLGGTLTAHPCSTGGFAVTAIFPLEQTQ